MNKSQVLKQVLYPFKTPDGRNSSTGHGGTGTFFSMIEQFVSRGLPAQFSNMGVPVHFSI